MPLIKGGAPGFAAATRWMRSIWRPTATPRRRTRWRRSSNAFPPAPIDAVPEPGRPFHLHDPRDMLKRYPAQIYTQSAVQAALALHPPIDSVDDIAVATVYGHRNVVAGVQGSAVPTPRDARRG